MADGILLEEFLVVSVGIVALVGAEILATRDQLGTARVNLMHTSNH